MIGASLLHSQLGDLYSDTGAHDKGLESLARADSFGLLQPQWSLRDSKQAEVACFRADIQLTLGRYPEALASYSDAYDAVVRARGSQSAEAASILINKGFAVACMEDYSGSLQTYQRAYAILRANGQKESISIGELLLKTAWVYPGCISQGAAAWAQQVWYHTRHDRFC